MEVRAIVLGPGESYTLRLTGRGARGYVWTWRVTGDEDAVAVSEADGPARPEPVPGAVVERAYLVRAGGRGGRARIRFAQVRPPYPEEAPYDEFLLEVTVTGGR
ncbi:protease inhibitor I42 family protein [Streptomyces sp. NPDC006512]|uniref:protease inhibitor I42 family protein n=1 Tax=Streptomyces sp. NPDC006512 TaxID=3154307 RepID=UPI0033AF8720